MNNYIISEAYAEGKEIGEIVERIEEAIGDVPRSHAIISCLSMAVFLQKPDIEIGELPKVVMEISKFICLTLAGTDKLDKFDSMQMN